MKAIINIVTKNHKGGEMYVANVNSLQEAKNYFNENSDYLTKQARKRNVERVEAYVNDNYQIIFSQTF